MTFKQYKKKYNITISNYALYLNDSKLTDLNGIEKYPDLEELYIDNNNIKDLEPLRFLKKLEYLCLSKNNIKDISPLKDLKNLRYLYIDNNKLNDSDLEIILNMNKLFQVSINGNNLSSVYDKYGSSNEYPTIYLYDENLIELKNIIQSQRRKRFINLL